MVFACATVLVNFLADILTVAARPAGEAMSDRWRCSRRLAGWRRCFGRGATLAHRRRASSAALRRCWRSPRRSSRPTIRSLQDADGAAAGAVAGCIPSAPTISAATSSRASSGARASTCRSRVIGVRLPLPHRHHAVGTVAGFFGGIVDAVFMRLVDVILAFPFLVLMLSIIAILGPGLGSFYIAMALVGWVSYARLIRAQMLVLKNQRLCRGRRQPRLQPHAHHVPPPAAQRHRRLDRLLRCPTRCWCC